MHKFFTRNFSKPLKVFAGKKFSRKKKEVKHKQVVLLFEVLLVVTGEA